MHDSEYPILVFEDDPNDALLLQRALKKNNMNNPVHIVTNGEEGLAYLQRQGPYADRGRFPFPRVILLDLKMPRKGGLEVLEYLRAHPSLKVIPTIVFTSSRETQDIERAYDLGANAFMVKPHDFDGLVQIMQKIREFWNASEKPKPKHE